MSMVCVFKWSPTNAVMFQMRDGPASLENITQNMLMYRKKKNNR